MSALLHIAGLAASLYLAQWAFRTADEPWLGWMFVVVLLYLFLHTIFAAYIDWRRPLSDD